MRILFFVTAHNSLSQRVYTALSDSSHGHELSVEYATSPEAMIEATELTKPDIILCPFLTRKVPKQVYEKYLTLIVHPGAPGDAGPSALDWVLMGDVGSSTNASDTLSALGPTLPTKPRSHWAVTVLQAEEEFDQGPIWAWEQFTLPAVQEVNGSAHATSTKAALYRGQVTRAALVGVLAALDRIEAASLQRTAQELSNDAPEPNSELPSIPSEPVAIEPLVPRFPVDLQPPAHAATLSVSLGAPFLGLQTQHRPLLRPAERAQACDPRTHSAVQCATVVRAGDSQPGVLVRWLDPRDAPSQGVQGRNMFIYGAWVEENRLPSWCDNVPVGRIVATRDGAVLIKSTEHGRLGGYGLWITHVRLPLAKGVTGGLNPKLPAVDGLRSAGLGAALENAREWNVCGKTVPVVVEQDKRSSAPATKVELGWEKRPGTWQQTWVEFEELRDGGKAAYVYFDYYNGACTTYQCEQLLRALRWAAHPDRGNIKVLVLMGGSYFSNGIALNTIEGSEDPSLESWKNINAINDVVEFVISDSSEAAKRLASNSKVPDVFKPLPGPSLVERGIITVAAIRSNVAAGGLALATAADIVLCAESAVINPHYRGVGLYGSEFHTYSFFERAGETKAREALRGMLPMSATEARQVGFVDEVMQGGDADGYVECTKAYVRALAGERASGMMTYKTAPWTHAIGEHEPTEPLLDVLVSNKLCTQATFDRPLVAYRHAELSEMLLDFYHPERSKRYSDRRRAFVRKLAPKSTPLRFATHRRKEGMLDDEEKDEFDAAPGWEAGTGVEWGWVGLNAPPSRAMWAPGEASPVRPPKNLARPTLSASPSSSSPPSSTSATPGLSTGSSLTDLTSPPSSVPGETKSVSSTLRPAATPTPAPTHDKQRARLSTIKMLRRKSDAGARAPQTEVPPVPHLAAPEGASRQLRRSRSSIEWGSRDINAPEHGEKKPTTAAAGRLSRWIKAIVPNTRVSPKGTASSTLPPVEPAQNQKKVEGGEGVKVEGEKQEILYPCYYNGNNE
ncbi:enoyl-CoA hydratase/isomerase family protein [Ceratobasidium sp. AG-Ba]|nr:enoyl-CoA hydratase/isomerase family protein [Ceratobasidium sp. AG-Ba]